MSMKLGGCSACGRNHGVSDPCVTIEMLEDEIQNLHDEVLILQQDLKKAIEVISAAKELQHHYYTNGNGSMDSLRESITGWDQYVASKTQACPCGN